MRSQHYRIKSMQSTYRTCLITLTDNPCHTLDGCPDGVQFVLSRPWQATLLIVTGTTCRVRGSKSQRQAMIADCIDLLPHTLRKTQSHQG